MAELGDRPYPPGDYLAVVVGSGPGALQTSHALSAFRVPHAVISADPEPGGMFRRFPFFQRLLSWTKPYAPVERGTRAYERYDWNSLTSDDPSLRAFMPELMDGSSYFPARAEMEANLVRFAERAGIRIRYGCRWVSTERSDDGRFVLTTSDGEYRCSVAIFAVGVAEPWKPSTPGIEHVPHYVETRDPASYVGKRIFIIGKQVSAFELATGLLPSARQIVLGSPSPAKLSVVTRNLVGVRARYVQPYEDYVLGGGLFVIDAAIERIDRDGEVFRVHTRHTSDGGETTFEVDEVIAATGFTSPLLDLPKLGVTTFGQSRLPGQTPFWESATVPGIYFAGTITQGSAGLKKHGVPSNSGAVHGHRYNARLLARHVAERHFGIQTDRPAVAPDDALGYLLAELTFAPELWNQRSYLARVLSVDRDRGIRDEGILPLAHYLDAMDGDGVAVTIEHDAQGAIYPAVYVRCGGSLTERLLPSEPVFDFRGAAYRAELAAALAPLIPAPVAA